MGRRLFSGLLKLDHLWTDEFRFCCLAREVRFCHPPPDEFSSCEDLMTNIMLRVCVWVLGTVAFSGNLLVIVWRFIYHHDNKVHSFLITNLALGDLCMGIYLLIIAAVDVNYRGVYFIYDALWRTSSLCQLAGFLSTFSSELSVFTLTVITLERFVVIIFPFRVSRLNMNWTRIIMGVVWASVGVLAALPLSNIHYFRNFYGRSGVCLALHITHEKPSGWEYSVFVFLALNLVSFSVIAASYWGMYRAASTTSAAVIRSDQQRRDSNMAKKMTLIVVTDAACWLPIILLGFVSLAGGRIPPQVFAWVAVFVLPLNAAVNPLLYTLSTAPFLGKARERVLDVRHSFKRSVIRHTLSSTTAISTNSNIAQDLTISIQ
ncbi:G-protein coupled receptor GRL101-like [Penaeus monodon]|uniref:G-protein coupled receptor GRL101-like n=1 Tax=Penaeus monodon TaxID=6687 RepID=UPI0018A74E2C|nr:G-protein coupled receptor GRL101-like [Penaeus monodon]